jgi:hypothetical protein
LHSLVKGFFFFFTEEFAEEAHGELNRVLKHQKPSGNKESFCKKMMIPAIIFQPGNL